MIQSSLWPAKQDLSKAWHDFEKWESRKSYQIWRTMMICGFLAVPSRNRSSTRLVLMNGQWTLAQKCLERLQSRSAMEVSFNGTVLERLYSWDLRLATASKWLVNDGQTNNARALWEILATISKSRNENFSEQMSFGLV